VTPLSAIAMDLDRFKALNDRDGHQAGDEALAAAGAAALAQKLRALIAVTTLPSVPSGITASFGVAELPDHARDADGLLRAADRALYAAKQGGRDRVELAAAAEVPVA
jgi:PleD family two-component response regulator